MPNETHPIDEIEQELESLDEIERALSDNQIRGYYIAALGTSLTAWSISFNLGVYDTLFFRLLFAVWVSSTALFVATLLLPEAERPIRSWGLFSLLAPSLSVLTLLLPGSEDIWDEILSVTIYIITLLSLPYIGYVVLLITQGEALRLPPRMLTGIVVLTLLIGTLGYIVGQNHQRFITCDQFAVAGEFVPEDCAE